MTGTTPPASPWETPPAGPKGGAARPVLLFVGGLVAVAVVAIIAVALLGPKDPPPSCQTDFRLCPDPPGGIVLSTPGPELPEVPELPSSKTPYVGGTVWSSSALGYEVTYDTRTWTVDRESETDLVLLAEDFWVLFEGRSASDATVGGLIEARLDVLRGFYPTVLLDLDAHNTIVGPHIGFVDAEGGTYIGIGTGTDGLPRTPTGFAMLGATDGDVVVAFTMAIERPEELLGGTTRQAALRTLGDTLLKNFRWPPP